MSQYVSIAIDGPAGAGKSTMAKRVAKDFGIDFVLEKYETNKELLASMMKANQRKLE